MQVKNEKEKDVKLISKLSVKLDKLKKRCDKAEIENDDYDKQVSEMTEQIKGLKDTEMKYFHLVVYFIILLFIYLIVLGRT